MQDDIQYRKATIEFDFLECLFYFILQTRRYLNWSNTPFQLQRKLFASELHWTLPLVINFAPTTDLKINF